MLGGHFGAGKMWLCLVDAEEGPVVTEPAFLELRDGEEAGYAMSDFHRECVHAITVLAPGRVVLLDPEPTGQATVANLRARFTAETLLARAAVELTLPVSRLARSTVRARLQLDRKGSFAERAGEVYPDKVGTHWKGKRDLAAVVASAALRDE